MGAGFGAGEGGVSKSAGAAASGAGAMFGPHGKFERPDFEGLQRFASGWIPT